MKVLAQGHTKNLWQSWVWIPRPILFCSTLGGLRHQAAGPALLTDPAGPPHTGSSLDFFKAWSWGLLLFLYFFFRYLVHYGYSEIPRCLRTPPSPDLSPLIPSIKTAPYFALIIVALWCSPMKDLTFQIGTNDISGSITDQKKSFESPWILPHIGSHLFYSYGQPFSTEPDFLIYIPLERTAGM